MAQTAVDYFADNVLSYKNPTNINGTNYILIPINKVEYLKQQAKQMEKEQIENAWHNGNLIETQEHYCGEQYYHETYFTRLQNETN